MVVIHVHVGKNVVENVLMDGGFDINIMMEEFWKQLRFPSFKLSLYTLWMAYQTITKPTRFIKNIKIQIHGIPCIVMFMIMKNIFLDFGYLMLLSRPWLRIACVAYDWGNNLITIEGNGMVRTIIMTKHLDSNTKHPKVLLCYNLTKKITNK